MSSIRVTMLDHTQASGQGRQLPHSIAQLYWIRHNHLTQRVKSLHLLTGIVVAYISRESVHSRPTTVASAKIRDIKRDSAAHRCTK